MQELYEGIELTATQTEWICRGLLDLAAVDGIDESETELVKEFYRGTGEDADIAALRAAGFDVEKAAKVFQTGGKALVEAFLVSAYLLIYADGKHSDQERTRIGKYAEAMGVDATELESLHVKARLYLLEVFAETLRNREVVKAMGISELGLTEAQVSSLMED
ncbi:MAG: hypothetical protein KC613_14245 [Myxococcales bacterium]|nr:hypothetical protein [Myxococcales bacterium]MCB9524670.1 hypothetical protein [Myxococcales bacterium]